MLVIFDCLFFSEIFKRIKHFLSGRQKSTRHSLRFNLIRNILSALLLNPHQKNEPRWRSYLLTQLLNQIKRKKLYTIALVYSFGLQSTNVSNGLN